MGGLPIAGLGGLPGLAVTGLRLAVAGLARLTIARLTVARLAVARLAGLAVARLPVARLAVLRATDLRLPLGLAPAAAKEGHHRDDGEKLGSIHLLFFR